MFDMFVRSEVLRMGVGRVAQRKDDRESIDEWQLKFSNEEQIKMIVDKIIFAVIVIEHAKKHQ